MNFLSEYGLFLLETITIVVAILITIAGIISLKSKDKSSKIKIKSLNKYYQNLKEDLESEIYDKKEIKKLKKLYKKKDDSDKANVFVLEFDGDLKASEVENLRETVSSIIRVAKPNDEVVIKIESGGGAVNAYGLAASQLQRLKDKNINLTACIDKIAASGGYLMASVANKVIAAPFAIIGSIGVVAQLPNFHRWLKKHNIDVEIITAGEYKRTLTLFGQNTDKGREKFSEEIHCIHEAFKQHIINHRPQVDLEKVANGEFWLANEAYQLKLVDKLATSDDYLLDRLETHKLFALEKESKPTVVERLFKPAAKIFSSQQIPF